MVKYQVQTDYKSKNGSNTYICIHEEANSESEAREKTCSKINVQILKLKVYKNK